MLRQLAIERLQEHLIRYFSHVHTRLIQDSKNALMLLFHQIHDDLIVKVVDLIQKHKTTSIKKLQLLVGQTNIKQKIKRTCFQGIPSL